MTSFISAMTSPDLTKVGVNGADVYTEAGVGDLRVPFYTMLVRGLQFHQLQPKVKELLDTGNPELIRDLLVLTFQTRDVRGGKGEKDLGVNMLAAILAEQPTWAKELVALVPEYGCWKDLWSLYDKCPAAQKAIDDLVCEQFQKDSAVDARPSLLAKWLPREGSKYDILAEHFADLLFAEIPATNGARRRAYRRECARINKILDTTEVKMCAPAGEWASIEAGHVPGQLMRRCKLAFFNQKNHRRAVVSRYPERKDRVECATNFRKHLDRVETGEVKMKGAETTGPEQHVAEILQAHEMSEEQMRTIEAQWKAIRDATTKLGNIVPMCDFSGSMNGKAKEVCLALGILLSEVASPAFRDHILTFDAKPRWHSFAGCSTLVEKVQSIGSLGQGLNTDFQAACDLVLRKLKEHTVAPADAPTDLLVLTDMGFDAARMEGDGYSYNVKTNPWQTHFQMIQSSFETAGYKAPRIVCWNLSAKYNDFQATTHEIGVVQLSGWSPSALKALQEDGIQVKTPYESLRKLLDAPRYDAVRAVADRLLKAGVPISFMIPLDTTLPMLEV